MNPETYPFGQTESKNYDPEQIETAADAIELFRWIADENDDAGNSVAADVFRDCANLLENEVDDD